MNSFRNAHGKPISWVDTGIDTGFSNFIFIDKYFHSSPVLRRIFSLARKLGYRSLLVEEIDDNSSELLSEENDALSIRCSSFRRSTVNRLLFLSNVKGASWEDQRLLGYVIFCTNHFCDNRATNHHIYESVMIPVRGNSENNFTHCSRSYTINSTQGPLDVAGTLYAQQNDLTFVCAHVALRTALSMLLPDQDISYSEINRICGIDHKEKFVGEGEGIDPNAMKEVIKAKGIACEELIHEPKAKDLFLEGDFQRDLYGIIESGNPALLGFELDDSSSRHIIPVFGHTFNEDTWVSEASRAYFEGDLKYYPSENWLSTYLVHDDNFGPYLCLPRHFLKKDNFRIMLGLKRHTTEFSAVEAESIGLSYHVAMANDLQFIQTGWLARFRVFTQQNLLVLRTLHITKSQYINHLEKSSCWDGNQLSDDCIQDICAVLPEKMWMIEASAPELFSASRRKFGEILLYSDKPGPYPLDMSLLIAARLPGLIFLQLEENSWKRIDTTATSHVPLFELQTNDLNESSS